MKTLSGLTLVMSLFAISVLLTGLAGLCSMMQADEAFLDMGALLKGHLGSLFGTPFVWSRYPAVPMPIDLLWGHLFNWTIFLLTVPLFGVAAYVFHFKARRLTLLVLACLVIGSIPHIAGLVALRNNTVPECIGPWLGKSILGLLYAFTACAVFSAIELVQTFRQRRSQVIAPLVG